MELVFLISSLGFALSLVTHLLAAFRVVEIPPGLAFAVFYPLMALAIFANVRVILMRRGDYSDEPPGEFWRHLTRNAPDWMRSLQVGLLLYGVFNFYFTMLVINRAGYPRYLNGVYVLERHKVLLETLTREQYLYHASYVVRMLSAIAMAVFFAGVMRLVARWRTVAAARPAAAAAEEAAIS